MPKTSLLMIPSQLCTAMVWEAQAADLCDIVDCHIADHTGHDSIAAIAASMLAAAPAAFALAAHGMGGFIAFELLRQAPTRISRLALFATLASADGPAQRQRREGYAELVRAGRFSEVVKARLPILLHPARRQDPGLLETIRSMALQTGADAFLRQQQAIMDRPDSRPDLPTIRCPTIVVAGRDDAIASLDDARALAAGIRNAHLHVLDDCGHLSPLEQPRAVNALLRRWLTRDAPAPAGG